ncbi:restriction endonuclease subunit S domain-containing protein [Treponema porcinum]|uniref:Type I restriction modification DNA specificity domain-containing protein n=1 Tax=Treponema porcinum TaxID=261392 RepID=A0A1T4M0W0_TREPO|nr:hypothetical protein [Treponema porcinum]SJZ60562.1 hypothetical protein SAMN02745149_01804 [Treponema porcinum]
MVLVEINAAGVEVYQLVQVVCIALQKYMKDKIPFVPLKEIATINQGLSIRSKIWKSSTREEIEDLYGLQKNDVVILRKMYSNGKKIAALVEDTKIVVVPSASSMIIRPDTTKIFPLYLKAFLEFLPSDKVIKELKLTSKKHLLSKGSLSKLLVPLPPVTEQIALSDKYDKVKTVDFYHRYANPIIEQYDSLMKFLWNCYQTDKKDIIS